MTDENNQIIEDAPLQRTHDIFNKMDLNQDGVISKEEFVKGCLKDETLYKLLACSGEEHEQTDNGWMLNKLGKIDDRKKRELYLKFIFHVLYAGT